MVREEEEAKGYMSRLPLLFLVMVVVVEVVLMALLLRAAFLHDDDGNGYQARPDAKRRCELPTRGVLGLV